MTTIKPDTPQTSLFLPDGNPDENRISEQFPPVKHKKGQIIFHQSTFPFGVYFLHRGWIKVYRTGGDGKEKIIRINGSGTFIGYTELISGDPYQTSALVLEDAALSFIPADVFQKQLKNNPVMYEAFLKIICHDLETAHEEITDLAFKPVKRRVADALLYLCAKKEASISEKTIELSRTDLAFLVGTAKETIARVLSEFKEKGWIASQGRNLVIKDRRALKEVSGTF